MQTQVYTAIHAIKSFHRKSISVSNKRLENKCNKCGRSHDKGKCPDKKIKHVLYAKEQGTLQNVAIKKIRNNPTHYKHPTSPTTDPPTTTEQIQEVHVIEEKSKEQAYTMVNMMKLEGKKVFHNTDQKVNVKLDGGVSANLMPTSVYGINPQMLDNNEAPLLGKFDKDWANLVAYGGSIIKQTVIKPATCKWGKKNFMTNFHIVCAEKHQVLFGLGTLRYLDLFVEHPLVFIEAVKIRP